MAQGASRFPFEAIAAQTDNTVHVPEGYSWDVLVRWGDPLFSDAPGASIPPPASSRRGSDRVFGENTDGMELFNIDGREILVVNSEYTNRDVNLPHTEDGVPTPRRRAHPAELPGRVRDGDRRGRGWLVGRGRQPLQPPHHHT
jgi:secreted PhoX family phosphatase